MRTGPRLALVLVLVAAAAKVAWISDDAYISFRTVDNLLQGHGPVWNPGERVQAYTHPLWLALLALAGAATGELYLTAIGLGLGLTALAGWWLTGLPGARRSWPVLLVPAATKCVPEYATSGLENALAMALVALICHGALAPAPGRAGAPRALALLCGLLPLVRPDLALVGLPLGLVLLREAGPPVLPWAVAPLACWTGFSAFYYGALVPNTALAKLGHGRLADDLVQGLAYVGGAGLRWDALAVGAAGVGLVRALGAGGRRGALGAGGLLYLAYVVAIGGDFMAGRFLVVPVLLGVVGLVGSAARPGLWGALALAAALLNPVGPWRTGVDFSQTAWDDAGIADERGWYFAHLGLWPRVAAGRAAPAPGRGGARAVVVGEAVGLDGYMAGPAVHLVDTYGLCDPLLSRLPSSEQRARPGHWRRALPAGYRATLETGENALEDEGLRRFYTDLARVTRGPLLAPERWGALGRVLGRWRVVPAGEG